MSPARKKRLEKRKKKNIKVGLKKPFFILIVAVGIFVFFRLTTFYWQKDSKLSVVVPVDNGDVNVLTFDPIGESITRLVIPGETQVVVARQLGTWRIKSVWGLGKDEGLSGKLLAETVIGQFKLPVYIWASQRALGYWQGDAKSILGSTISFYDTNLGVGDKLRLAIFSFRVKNFKKQEIDLSSSSILKKRTLVDGEDGYIVTGSTPANILAVFSDTEIAYANSKVQIIDSTKSKLSAETVGEVLETVGMKVASITKAEEEDIDCLVSGSIKKAVDEVINIFSCKEGEEDTGAFDLVIKIGNEFEKRF